MNVFAFFHLTVHQCYRPVHIPIFWCNVFLHKGRVHDPYTTVMSPIGATSGCFSGITLYTHQAGCNAMEMLMREYACMFRVHSCGDASHLSIDSDLFQLQHPGKGFRRRLLHNVLTKPRCPRSIIHSTPKQRLFETTTFWHVSSLIIRWFSSTWLVVSHWQVWVGYCFMYLAHLS